MRAKVGAIAVVSGLLWCAAPAAAANNVALVIGNGAYRTADITPLPNPPNDASAVSTLLEGIGYTVITVVNGTIEQMDAALTRLEYTSREADSVVVFYAGHGIQASGQNFLLPIDAQIDSVRDLRRQALSLEDIFAAITLAQPRVSIVILDACRNNPLSRSLAARLGRAFGVGRGLAPVSDARGVLVAYATAPNEIAEDGAGANSPFTSALVEHLPTPGIDVRTMFARVRETVVEQTEGRQTPWTEDGLVGEFIFAPAPPDTAPEPVAVPAAPTLPAGATVLQTYDKETVFWQSAERQDTIGAYQAYLKAFPDGTYVPLARTNIAVLQRRQEANQQLESPGPADPSPAVTPSSPERPIAPAEATQMAAAMAPPPAMAPEIAARPSAAAQAPQVAVVPAMPRVPEADDPVAIEPIGETYFPIANANVRTQPSRDGRRITTLAMGTEVHVLGKVVGANWYKVRLASGDNGYIYAKLLVLAKSAAQLGQVPVAPAPPRGGNAGGCEAPNAVMVRAVGDVFNDADAMSARIRDVIGELRDKQDKPGNTATARGIYGKWVAALEAAAQRAASTLPARQSAAGPLLQLIIERKGQRLSVAELVDAWSGQNKAQKSRGLAESVAALATQQTAVAGDIADKIDAAKATHRKVLERSPSCGRDFRCSLAIEDGRKAYDTVMDHVEQMRRNTEAIANSASSLANCLRSS